ncbi:MAG: hypothetical protein LBQ12_12665 [Deltaproteobacteria bacterium]|jgi:hypothetical protein|nr:hypothetical protein [Deltaproteobacteria bacterium]
MSENETPNPQDSTPEQEGEAEAHSGDAPRRAGPDGGEKEDGPLREDPDGMAESHAGPAGGYLEKELKQLNTLKAIYKRLTGDGDPVREEYVRNSNKKVDAFWAYIGPGLGAPPLAELHQALPPVARGALPSPPPISPGPAEGRSPKPPEHPAPDPALPPPKRVQKEAAWYAAQLLPYYEEEKKLQERSRNASSKVKALMEYAGISGGPDPLALPFELRTLDKGLTAAAAVSFAEGGDYSRALEALAEDRWMRFDTRAKIDTLVLTAVGLTAENKLKERNCALKLIKKYADLAQDKSSLNRAVRLTKRAEIEKRVPDSLRYRPPAPARRTAEPPAVPVKPAPSAPPENPEAAAPPAPQTYLASAEPAPERRMEAEPSWPTGINAPDGPSREEEEEEEEQEGLGGPDGLSWEPEDLGDMEADWQSGSVKDMDISAPPAALGKAQSAASQEKPRIGHSAAGAPCKKKAKQKGKKGGGGKRR